MKKLKFLLLFFVFAGCDKTYYCEFAVKNETEHRITIEGFDRFDMNKNPRSFYKKKPEIIQIMPHSSFSIVKARGYHADPDGVFNSIEIDSVNIIFDDEKIIVQQCTQYLMPLCDINRNLMGFDTEYDRKKIGRSFGEIEYRYTYTITLNDYNRAIPIKSN